MTLYYLTYLLIWVLYNISKNSSPFEKKRNALFCSGCFILIFALLALRSPEMGVDLLGRGEKTGYLGSFDIISRYSFHQVLKMENYLNYERGYIIFNKLISMIYNNKQFFLGVCAFLSVLPVMIHINKRSKDTLLSVYIYMALPVFLIAFSGLRQAIAIAITVFSVKFIEEKKFIKFILLVLFASTFHSSSIIFLVAYPLYYLKLSDKSKFLFVLTIPVVYVFRTPIFNIASKIFKESAGTEETGAFTLFLVFFLIYIFLIFFNKKQDTHQNGMINIFYFACICQAFGSINQLAMRVGYYFMIYSAIAIPNTIAEMEDKRSAKLAQIILFGIFILYGLYALKSSTWAGTNPYNFFWQESSI